MKSLREYIDEARDKGVAIGHFNISNLEALRGIFNAAKEKGLPIIIGVSEGERDFIGVKQAVALVKSLRDEYEYPIFLNADHTYSFERVKEAIDAGYDSVIFDGTKLSLEDNIKITKQCVEYAHRKNPDILVEGELGYIGQSSKVLDEVPEGVVMTNPEDAKKFVVATGVDMLAPAVGNIHGMLSSGIDPALNIDLIKKISAAVGIPLVLHGASGNSAADIKAAIASGVALVHINTEIRVAYRDAVRDFLQNNPKEVAPYKFLKPGLEAVQKVVSEKLGFFNEK
ncbi:TPA: tagatose-bisphosphate aldolase [Candidatus Taylorbacteria bacterium]|nr:tagatose-bisphosphate aldolase [Candidatus Taylorbacteria bacterium]